MEEDWIEMVKRNCLYENDIYLQQDVKDSLVEMEKLMDSEHTTNPTKWKVFSIFMELFQFVSRLSGPEVQHLQKLYFTKDNDYWYIMKVTNLDSFRNIKKIQEQIAYVNTIIHNKVALKELYQRILHGPYRETISLGWATIARRSRIPIQYQFKNREAEHPTFYVMVRVAK